MSLADRRISSWLAILTFCVYGWFYAGAGWNQNATFDLTRALVERHTFAIDDLARNTGDVSRANGHIYANKAPALSFLAAIPYAPLYWLERAQGVDSNDALTLTINSYLCTLAICGLLGALVPLLLYREGRARGTTPLWCATVALTMAFATQLFPYATVLMVVVPSGALMLLALTSRRDALAGFAAGLATAMNYVCLPAVVFFGITRIVRRRDAALQYVAGALIPLMALGAYQRICFGGFFTNSVAKTDPRFLDRHLILGVIQPPSMEAFLGITVSPYRGLFYGAPVLLMAFAGAYAWLRTRERVAELAAVAATAAVFFAFNVSFNGWEGGFGIGARYLVPTIPLAGLAMLYLRGAMRPLFLALAAISLVQNFTAAAVDPQPSGTIPRPMTQYLLPLLVYGRFSPDVPITHPWSAETFTGHTSVNRMAPDEPVVFFFHPPGSNAAEWASFNLGEPFFGPGDWRSLLPVVLLLACGSAFILDRARRATSTLPAPPS